MSTLGDPLSDAALTCGYRTPEMDLILNMRSAWTSSLIPSADQLAQRYSEVSGRRLSHWPFYMALAYFKIAIIAAGIDVRRIDRVGDDQHNRLTATTFASRRRVPSTRRADGDFASARRRGRAAIPSRC